MKQVYREQKEIDEIATANNLQSWEMLPLVMLNGMLGEAYEADRQGKTFIQYLSEKIETELTRLAGLRK